jgi:hypothetical protein
MDTARDRKDSADWHLEGAVRPAGGLAALSKGVALPKQPDPI